MGVFNPDKDMYRWIRINAVPQYRYGEDKPYQVYTTFDDITEIKIAEEKLQESEKKYRILVENINDVIFNLDKKGIITYISPVIEQITGFKPEKIIGQDFTTYLHPDDSDEIIANFKRTMAGDLEPSDFRIFHKDGTCLYVRTSSRPTVEDGEVIGLTGVLSDITQQKKAEKQIEKSLEEKVVLLREIHHRVKNNMQVISSLLNLQSTHIKDEDDLEIFKEGQSRVKSMAMIHEKLYQSEDFAKIDFGEYIQSLANEIFAFNIVGSNIKVSINSKNVFFNVDTAIPLGLIMNELLTNSVKHAFPDDKEGEIQVYLKKEDERYLLIVRDNGIGFPQDMDFRKTETLGLQLVNRLVDQLDGTIKLDRSHGTEFKIHFKELKY